jgi:hypothetical protein
MAFEGTISSQSTTKATVSSNLLPTAITARRATPLISASTQFKRSYIAFNSFLFTSPSMAGISSITSSGAVEKLIQDLLILSSSSINAPASILEFPQIDVSSAADFDTLILSTENDVILVTSRNENFDDEAVI